MKLAIMSILASEVFRHENNKSRQNVTLVEIEPGPPLRTDSNSNTACHTETLDSLYSHIM